MTYTISEVARMMGVAPHTLRFYDQQGLLPFVDRVNGRRVFKDEDFAWLHIINCLKNTGMSIKDIHTYIELCGKGDQTLIERQAIIVHQKELVEKKIKELESNLEVLASKMKYYDEAIKAGTESVFGNESCSPKTDIADNKE